ncbi:GatB/YqeY domain-containing protein [Pedomonas mirosovicensis]|uniref:GatB/YqeY domain-containing protein n=1 Tax=Pedomonas mirosovicensis TaxID=2908641 RepID=UPI00216A5020|nr:GatB/YqeY domain-containing protein [Pedomonas mirosovicensis]MCH8685499.1 GatB/YqeY domain-containing protein [Pedomonas mirosovicensis]
MIRDAIKQALVEAMKAKDTQTVSTLRMAQAAIKNRDIELRTSEAPANDDALVIDVLTKMVKQRRESVEMYEKGGRAELAEAERGEIAVLERFLPQVMSDDEAQKVINTLVAELGASSPKDMGRVMGALKERYAGQIDMGKAGPMVKAALAG